MGHHKHRSLDVGKGQLEEAPYREVGVGGQGDQLEVFDDAQVQKAAVLCHVRARLDAWAFDGQGACLWRVIRLWRCRGGAMEVTRWAEACCDRFLKVD